MKIVFHSLMELKKVQFIFFSTLHFDEIFMQQHTKKINFIKFVKMLQEIFPLQFFKKGKIGFLRSRFAFWYFVNKIVLTYGEKKNVLVIENFFWNSRLKAKLYIPSTLNTDFLKGGFICTRAITRAMTELTRLKCKWKGT